MSVTTVWGFPLNPTRKWVILSCRVFDRNQQSDHELRHVSWSPLFLTNREYEQFKCGLLKHHVNVWGTSTECVLDNCKHNKLACTAMILISKRPHTDFSVHRSTASTNATWKVTHLPGWSACLTSLRDAPVNYSRPGHIDYVCTLCIFHCVYVYICLYNI